MCCHIYRTQIRVPWIHQPSSTQGPGGPRRCANISPALDHPPLDRRTIMNKSLTYPAPARAPHPRGPGHGPHPRPLPRRASRRYDLAGLVRAGHLPCGHGLHGHAGWRTDPSRHVAAKRPSRGPAHMRGASRFLRLT